MVKSFLVTFAAIAAAGMVRAEIAVDGNVPAGNIIVEEVKDGVVRLRQDMRDSNNWFYWAFRVTGAEGKTLKFVFTDPYAGGPISCRGPAVTRDRGETWSYAAEATSTNDVFTYTFAADEKETWFYQTFQYFVTQWDAFLKRHEADRGRLFTTGVLCKSRKGREVPNALFGRIDGKAKYRVFLSGRHHCGETQSDYCIEGWLETVFEDSDLGRWLRENVEFMVVPFVDYDGVVDGDQGKGRHPHDHNRDYNDFIYPETRGIRDWVKAHADNDIDVFLDIHSPWVRNQYNEKLYQIMGPDEAENALKKEWGELLEKLQCGSMNYHQADDFPWNFGWNRPSNVKSGQENVKGWAKKTLKHPMIINGYEIPFANAMGRTVTPRSCRELGHDSAKVLKEFVERRARGQAAVPSAPKVEAPKYVFLFIGDGMSVPHRMTANEFSIKAGKGPLRMNDMPYSGLARSASADALVTDSAAAATAIACGVKTKNGRAGVDPEGKPVASCAELAKKAGRRVGIMTTVTITHATPAGFYAHRPNRGDMEGISKDLVDSGFEFFAGGGLAVDESKSKAYEYAAEQGYRIVTNRNDFLALRPSDGRILTRFRNDAFEYAIDRREGSNEPTIAEMTAKAVEMLDGEGGFFIMCEGGKVDHCGHGNDAATNLREIQALDEAVGVALDFQAAHPDDTLIIVTGDHETGGMTMGFAGTGYRLYTENLAHQTVSVNRFNAMIREEFRKTGKVLSFEEIKPLVEKGFGLRFAGDPKKDPMVLSKNDIASIREAYEYDVKLLRGNVAETTDYMAKLRYRLGNACRTVVSHKSGIDWTSGAHTAMPVLTTSKGPKAERFGGYFENCEIGRRLKELYTTEAK